jgi:AcrR family transcriptional regulator
MTLGVVATGIDVLSVSDRDRILQAMADCCAEVGYRETTVEAVMERADVSQESFASHFVGKEDCALAALNRVVSETLARISMAHADVEGAVEQRKYDVSAILELLAARPSFAQLAAIDARQGGTRRMHDSYESAAAVLALMVERTAETGWRPSMAARAALGGAEALVRREIASGRAWRLPQLLPDFVYAALVPWVGQREALRQAKLAARMVAEEE